MKDYKTYKKNPIIPRLSAQDSQKSGKDKDWLLFIPVMPDVREIVCPKGAYTEFGPSIS